MAKQATTKEVKKEKKKREYVTITNGIDYWSPKKKGDQFEGSYIETLRKENPDLKNGFGDIETNEAGKKVKVQHYAVCENEEGKQIGMPSTKMMNEFFADVEKGKYVRITFNGKKLKKGKTKGEANSEYNDYVFEKEK